jgi:hypothetical protein
MPVSTIPNSGDRRVDAALSRIREKFTDLEDAMVVHAHLEKRSSERLKEHDRLFDNLADVLESNANFLKLHQKWLGSHEKWLESHEAGFASHEKAKREHEEWLKHISDKLDVLTDIVMSREGGSEARA